ncbi:MAG TPA: DUF92 domain-containing protein [Gemmatimonadales bacterium]
MKWLTADGAAAALAVGGAVLAGFGWRGGVLLLAFFVSSSLLTQISGGKGGRRNARQVLANGAVAAAAALIGSWPLAAGALAAATADTWATEIGAFSPRPPRLITNMAPVTPGTSGGVTVLGTAGGVVGAAALGALATVLEPRGTAPGLAHPDWTLAAVVGGAGIVGMLMDSLLGATLQGEWECAACGARFERRVTVCHEPVRRTRGVGWLDNDGVNLVATLVGAVVAAWLA